MNNFKTTLLALVAFMGILVTGCTPNQEAPQSEAAPQARQVVSSQTFHAYMPNSTQDVYQMDLTVFSDGTSEATRSVVPFNSNYEFGNLYIVGESNLAQGPDGVDIGFDGDAWFIPFDGQAQPDLIMAGGGTTTVVCDCSGSGGCNAQITYGWFRKRISCENNNCDGSCNMGVGSASSYGGTYGVMVASHAVTAN